MDSNKVLKIACALLASAETAIRQEGCSKKDQLNYLRSVLMYAMLLVEIDINNTNREDCLQIVGTMFDALSLNRQDLN